MLTDRVYQLSLAGQYIKEEVPRRAVLPLRPCGQHMRELWPGVGWQAGALDNLASWAG